MNSLGDITPRERRAVERPTGMLPPCPQRGAMVDSPCTAHVAHARAREKPARARRPSLPARLSLSRLRDSSSGERDARYGLGLVPAPYCLQPPLCTDLEC